MKGLGFSLLLMLACCASGLLADDLRVGILSHGADGELLPAIKNGLEQEAGLSLVDRRKLPTAPDLSSLVSDSQGGLLRGIDLLLILEGESEKPIGSARLLDIEGGYFSKSLFFDGKLSSAQKADAIKHEVMKFKHSKGSSILLISVPDVRVGAVDRNFQRYGQELSVLLQERVAALGGVALLERHGIEALLWPSSFETTALQLPVPDVILKAELYQNPNDLGGLDLTVSVSRPGKEDSKLKFSSSVDDLPDLAKSVVDAVSFDFAKSNEQEIDLRKEAQAYARVAAAAEKQGADWRYVDRMARAAWQLGERTPETAELFALSLMRSATGKDIHRPSLYYGRPWQNINFKELFVTAFNQDPASAGHRLMDVAYALELVFATGPAKGGGGGRRYWSDKVQAYARIAQQALVAARATGIWSQNVKQVRMIQEQMKAIFVKLLDRKYGASVDPLSLLLRESARYLSDDPIEVEEWQLKPLAYPIKDSETRWSLFRRSFGGSRDREERRITLSRRAGPPSRPKEEALARLARKYLKEGASPEVEVASLAFLARFPDLASSSEGESLFWRLFDRHLEDFTERGSKNDGRLAHRRLSVLFNLALDFDPELAREAYVAAIQGLPDNPSERASLFRYWQWFEPFSQEQAIWLAETLGSLHTDGSLEDPMEEVLEPTDQPSIFRAIRPKINKLINDREERRFISLRDSLFEEFPETEEVYHEARVAALSAPGLSRPLDLPDPLRIDFTFLSADHIAERNVITVADRFVQERLGVDRLWIMQRPKPALLGVDARGEIVRFDFPEARDGLELEAFLATKPLDINDDWVVFSVDGPWWDWRLLAFDRQRKEWRRYGELPEIPYSNNKPIPPQIVGDFLYLPFIDPGARGGAGIYGIDLKTARSEVLVHNIEGRYPEAKLLRKNDWPRVLDDGRLCLGKRGRLVYDPSLRVWEEKAGIRDAGKKGPSVLRIVGMKDMEYKANYRTEELSPYEIDVLEWYPDSFHHLHIKRPGGDKKGLILPVEIQWQGDPSAAETLGLSAGSFRDTAYFRLHDGKYILGVGILPLEEVAKKADEFARLQE